MGLFWHHTILSPLVHVWPCCPPSPSPGPPLLPTHRTPLPAVQGREKSGGCDRVSLGFHRCEGGRYFMNSDLCEIVSFSLLKQLFLKRTLFVRTKPIAVHTEQAGPIHRLWSHTLSQPQYFQESQASQSAEGLPSRQIVGSSGYVEN